MLHRCSVLNCVLRILAGIIVSIASIAAQTTGAGKEPIAANRATALETIVAGDSVQVSVFGHPELSQQVRVANDGSARLSLLGEVVLAGLTEPDAGTMIEGQLRDRNVLLHPRVNVTISESTTQN